MASRLRRFLALDRSRQRLLLEAAGCLVIAYGVVRWVPLRRYAGSLEEGGGSDGALDARTGPIAADVAWSIRAVSARLPWTSTCLMNAAAGQWMLARRGVPATLTLGLARDDGSGGVTAHAWLTSGAVVLEGERSPSEHYTVLGEFRSRG